MAHPVRTQQLRQLRDACYREDDSTDKAILERSPEISYVINGDGQAIRVSLDPGDSRSMIK